ncbi:acetate--CoA ligase family protein [bacterium]|nr:acetate--CoA ligase family protein [bacterium]
MQDILSPQSIAIVGVSDDINKIGSVIMRNLIRDGFYGKIYPINPKYSQIQGVPAFGTILEVPDNIDTVCIAIPHQFVEGVIDQCIEKKVKSVVIVTAGFKETGAEGKEIEERIASKLKEAGIRLIGPNCLGYINNEAQINLSFARENPGKGSVAFISQSGAFCAAILDMACEKGLGFSHVISLGNKADLNENELLPMLIKDDNVKSIAIYLEQFTDGKEFVSIAQKSKKPIVIIAPGSSQKSQKAISSHTGSLASSYDTTVAAIKKANLILAENTEELFTLMQLVNQDILPKGKRIGIVTNAGGPGIIAVDRAEKEGLEVVDLEESTTQALMKDLPEESSIANPVDVLGDAKSDRYASAIKTMLSDKNVDVLVNILTPQLVTDIEGTAQVVAEITKDAQKPIYNCFLGCKDIKNGNKILQENHCTAFGDIQEAMHLISKLANYELDKRSSEVVDCNSYKKKPKHMDEIMEYVADDSVTILPDEIAIELMDEFDIKTPKQLVTSSMEKGRDFAATIFPVAIKATAEDLAHKTDFKGLYLDIRTISEFEEKFEELRQTITKVTGKTAPKILIQQMIEGNVEIFVGANREGHSDIYEKDGLGFGHLLAVGQGGIYTEVYKDITHILLPEVSGKMDEKLSLTNVSTIINGYRGKPKLAREKLIELLMNIQNMLITYPQIVSMDINPVILTTNEALVVDIKLYLKK